MYSRDSAWIAGTSPNARDARNGSYLKAADHSDVLVDILKVLQLVDIDLVRADTAYNGVLYVRLILKGQIHENCTLIFSSINSRILANNVRSIYF